MLEDGADALPQFSINLLSARLTDDQKRDLQTKGLDEIEAILVAGDYQNAVDLADMASAGDEMAGAYLEWLRTRTEGLMRRLDFWPRVEALAQALLERKVLSGKEVRELTSNVDLGFDADLDALADRLDRSQRKGAAGG